MVGAGGTRLTVGHEINGTLRWSQPELALYDRRRDHGHGEPPAVSILEPAHID
jgi:hypothetical protein